jgi:hydrogenase maturation protease
LTTDKPSLFIYGYGNPGRQDDGLGVLLAEHMEAWAKQADGISVTTDSNYQLNIEDAEAISAYDIVVFADATQEEIPDFRLEALHPSPSMEFTMHAVSPAFILHLCHQVFNKHPRAWLLHIRGYEWEFMAPMTDAARENLKKAEGFLREQAVGFRL